MSIDDPLAVLEIISNGKTIWQAEVEKLGIDIEKSINLGTAKQPAYYYLRAKLKNGALIYASPVFVEVAGS